MNDKIRIQIRDTQAMINFYIGLACLVFFTSIASITGMVLFVQAGFGSITCH